MGYVEVDTILTSFFQLLIDGPGNSISGGQIFTRIILFHKWDVISTNENTPFTADRFRDQKVFFKGMIQTCWVELDKFHISNFGTGPEGHGHPIPCGNIRICSVEIDLSHPTTTEGSDLCPICFNLPIHHHIGAHTFFRCVALPPLNNTFSHQQINYNMFFKQLYPFVISNFFKKCPFNLPTGQVIGMCYPAMAMPPFPSQRKT